MIIYTYVYSDKQLALTRGHPEIQTLGSLAVYMCTDICRGKKSRLAHSSLKGQADGSSNYKQPHTHAHKNTHTHVHTHAHAHTHTHTPIQVFLVAYIGLRCRSIRVIRTIFVEERRAEKQIQKSIYIYIYIYVYIQKKIQLK